jgi:hypothetical protein
MGFFIKSFNHRWSLHIVKGNQLAYAMHANSVMQLIGYVMNYFANNGRPVEPWSLYLSSNGQIVMLGSEHFTSDGENPTPRLIEQIDSLDSRWKYFKVGKVWFEEAATKKHLKITNAPPHSDGTLRLSRGILRQCLTTPHPQKPRSTL